MAQTLTDILLRETAGTDLSYKGSELLGSEHDNNWLIAYNHLKSIFFRNTEPAYNAGTTYKAGMEVYFEGELYLSLLDDNIDNTPGIGGSETYWELQTPNIKNIRSISYTALKALILAEGLYAGSWYLIYDLDEKVISGDENVLVFAVSNSMIAIDGYYFALNADYQGVGNYSDVETWDETVPPLALGIWYAGLADTSRGILTGDVVIRNGLHYRKKTDNYTTDAPEDNGSEYETLTKTLTTGYILEIDKIDIKTNYSTGAILILYREDKRMNRVKGLISQSNCFFPFGNDNVTYNEKDANTGNISNFRGILTRCKIELPFVTIAGIFDEQDEGTYTNLEFKTLSINTQNGIYEINLSDCNKLVIIEGTTPEINIPLNETVPLPIGFSCKLTSIIGGTLTSDEGTTVYAYDGNFDLQIALIRELIKIDTNTWILSGALEA